MLLDVVYSHRLKCSVADVQCDFNHARTSRAAGPENFGSEMQIRQWARQWPRVHARRLSDSVPSPQRKCPTGVECKAATASRPAHLVTIPGAVRPQTSAAAAPLLGFQAPQLAAPESPKRIRAPAFKRCAGRTSASQIEAGVADATSRISNTSTRPPDGSRCPISRAGNTRVLLTTSTSPGANVFRKHAKFGVRVGLRFAIQDQHPRRVALLQRLLRDQFFGKFIVEIRELHIHGVRGNCSGVDPGVG